MNTEKTSNRKEWVKNAAIIFLSVMLVLTFFSNTIMNYSLPEVATAQIVPGSITAKIRGTGSLTSDDPYVISIGESRKIASVAVKQGDVVEKDQVLFYLEDVESAELEEAQKMLNELLLTYSNQILKGDISNEAFERIQSGKVSSNTEYQKRINEAKQKVEHATYIVQEFDKYVKLAQNGDITTIDRNAELEKEKQKLETLETLKNEAQSAKDTKVAELGKYTSDTSLNTYQGTLEIAKGNEAVKRAEFESKRGSFFDTVREKLGELYGEKYKDEDLFEEKAKDAKYLEKLIEAAKKVDDTKKESNGSDNQPTDGNGEDVSSTAIIKTSGNGSEGEEEKAMDKFQALQTAYNDYLTAKNARKEAEANNTQASSDETKKSQVEKELAALEKAYEKAKAEYNAQEKVVKQLTVLVNDTKISNEKHMANLNTELISANIEKEKAQEELTQLLTDISTELNLSSQNQIIQAQREKVARLKEKAVGAVITAPIAGTVTGVHKSAGETTGPNEQLLVMQPEGKGFSMSFSVTPEQAQKVTVGELAEIQNSWYYNDIKATLSAIRPDPESNGTKKLLVFDITGDVQVGQSISLSIGQKSANYDLVVPNSAVREDNNGKFILIVESKNSPLGNRYIAKRIDVEVLGVDDTKTGIKAPLYGYEFVITTATQPVEAGKQIRLAEN